MKQFCLKRRAISQESGNKNPSWATEHIKGFFSNFAAPLPPSGVHFLAFMSVGVSESTLTRLIKQNKLF